MISIGAVTFELNSQVDMALRKELLDNASTILTTLRGTNPQARAMGLVSSDIIGKPAYVAKGAYMVQAIEQIDLYEPRLSVVEISFEIAESKIIPKVVLTYNGS
jgi:phage baseplate assembly protein W